MTDGEEAYRQRAYGCYRTTASAHPLRSSEMTVAAKVRQYRQRWGRFVPQDRDAPILDLGCGSGEFLYFLQREGYTNLHGVDTSPDQVEAAHALGLENVELGDVREYVQQHKEAFDVIAALSLLEHLKRDEMLELLDGVVRALRPEGVFPGRGAKLQVPLRRPCALRRHHPRAELYAQEHHPGLRHRGIGAGSHPGAWPGGAWGQEWAAMGGLAGDTRIHLCVSGGGVGGLSLAGVYAGYAGGRTEADELSWKSRVMERLRRLGYPWV